MTYRLFTTAEDVLTALINCLLQKDTSDTSKNRVSMFVHQFVCLGINVGSYICIYIYVYTFVICQEAYNVSMFNILSMVYPVS